ncbi:uncharacterized protein [Haliotis asinina]|uniref:uncharacterized protein n=1 Tax=Haliotis asinina TaxID=109174 RepID=UPI0035320933
MVNVKSTSEWNQEELVEKKSLHVTFEQRSAARTTTVLPGTVQHLKPQPLRHVQLQEFHTMESLCNEEFLSMAYKLVLDYKDFLEDQLSSLLNLAQLKREHSLSVAYNQVVLATMGSSDVENLVKSPPNPRYLARLPFIAFYEGVVATSVVFLPGHVTIPVSRLSDPRMSAHPSGVESLVRPSSNPLHLDGQKKGLPFVAFYDGNAKTAVILLPGAIEQINGLATNSIKKAGPFVAFYDGMVATAQIFLPGAIEQTYDVTPSIGFKAVLLRRSYAEIYEQRAATARALMPVNVQVKPQPLRHVPLVGFKSKEGTSKTYNQEFMSMVRTLVFDYKDFLEEQLSSLLNLALFKRQHSLSVAYNQVMFATVAPSEVESLVRAPSNPRNLAKLPFIAFYEGIAATAVVFLPGHVTIPVSRTSPRQSTQMETVPNHNITHNDGIIATAQMFLPFLQTETQSEVKLPKPRPLIRPQWSRAEKCRLLKDKLDGLPLRYKPRTTKYITFEEKEIHTRQRILNTIPSLKTVYPGSCLARSPLTPRYSLEETYPDMVSATFKDLDTQHMKYFRASPSRAPGRRAGRTQIQIMEDLYWEKLRKMGAPETADDIANRRQQEMCFTRKLWYGSVIKETNLKSDHTAKTKLNTRSAHLNDTACLNTNNNGYTKEEGDCDKDTADSSVFGSKSDQGFSRGQDVARKKARHSYLNKRHSDGYRSRNRGPAGLNGTYADFHQTHLESEAAQNESWKGSGQFTDSPLPLQCQRKDATLTQREPDFNPTDRGLGRISFVPHEPSTLRYDGKFFEETFFQKGTPEDDAIHLKELLKDVSKFDSVSDVPKSTLERVLLLTCKPFLKGGYRSGLCFLSNLIQSPECSPEQLIQNLDQCADQCGSTGSAAVSPTDSPVEIEENSDQKQRDVLYRESCYMRLEQFPVFEAKSADDNGFIGDLSFTDNSPDDRTETPHSFLHDDFIHEDDVLDIPTLSILSPSRASLGQAYPSGHVVTSFSIQDHDKDKPASHEPFPSEYVFKRACGPSFRVSSEFWHIQIPTLPSDMVDYKVEADGLTEIVIGSGCFGEVYAATLTVSPGQSRDVVVKEHFTDKTTQESIASEAKITMYLESTGCVPICYGLLSDEEDGYNIVMEYVGSGQTLYDVMRESELPRLHWLNIVCQLVSGLDKIHKKDVLINDIKSDNILVDMSGELPLVKFCDMGAASYKSGVTYRGPMENCVHLAPEACAHAETTAACDVFSLGRVLKKIHGVSQISTLLVVSDMCMAEDPSRRPTLEAVNQLLQGEYTRELMFPTVTVPSHGYLDSIEEESHEVSAGSILRVNTPVDEDQPTAAGPGSAEVNGAVSSDSKSGGCSPKSRRSFKVSPAKDKASVTTINKHELGTSVAADIHDIYSISFDHVPHIHVAGLSHRNAVSRVNMTKGASSSAEAGDTSVVVSMPAQKQTEALFNNMEAATPKSAESRNTSMTNIVDVATSRYVEHGNGSLDTMPPEGTCELPTAFSSPDGSYEFYAPPVPPSSPASSCASCHLRGTSSSTELSLAANSHQISVTMETLDTASSELQTSHCHAHDASSDNFVDAVEDDLDADASSGGHCTDADAAAAAAAVIPVVVNVDGNCPSPSLEAPHVAEYHTLCQAELEVYNKYCEGTSVCEDYLPLVLPLLMIPLGFFGVI